MTLADRIAKRRPAARRTLAVLLLFVTATLAERGFIVPIREVLTSQQRWRVAVGSELALARGRAAEVPLLEDHLKLLPDMPIWQRFYPDGHPVNVDTAFRGDIARYAAVAGITIRSIAPIPATKQLGLNRLGMNISATMTIGQLTDFLTDLRRSPRYLRVDALRVVAPQVQVENANYRLLVEMQILGYVHSASEAGK